MNKPSTDKLFLVKRVQLSWLTLLYCPLIFLFLPQCCQGWFRITANVYSCASFLPISHKCFSFPPDTTIQLLIKSFTSFRSGFQSGNLSALGWGFFCISGAFVGAERFIRTWWVRRNSEGFLSPLVFLELLSFWGGSWSFLLHLIFFSFSLTGNVGLFKKKLPVILDAIFWSLMCLMCWDQQDEWKLLTDEQCSSRNSAFSPESSEEDMMPEEFPRLGILNWGFPTWNSCMYTEAFLFIYHLSNKPMAHMYICLWSTRKCFGSL